MMVGFGGETLEALGALALLGMVLRAVLLVPLAGALATVGSRNAFVCCGLLAWMLRPPVSLLVLVAIASSFDVEPLCSWPLDVGLLRSRLVPVVAVAAE